MTAEAAGLGVMMIADCVFNHSAVVASRNEWEAPQKADTQSFFKSGQKGYPRFTTQRGTLQAQYYRTSPNEGSGGT